MTEKSHARAIPEEKAASREEIHAAFYELNDAQLNGLRNISLVRSLDLVGRHCEFDDDQSLLKMAFEKLLSRERKWDKEKVDFFGFMSQTMRSIANHAREHLLTKNAGIESKSIKLESKDSSSRLIENIAADQSCIENSLIAKQDIEKIEEYFSVDETVMEIISGFREGMSGADIQEILGISKTEYETARKKMLRGCKKLSQEGKLND